MAPLARAADVATLLNVRPATVYDLARRGLLPHVRLREGTRRPLVRFDLEQVEQYIRDHSTIANTASK